MSPRVRKLTLTLHITSSVSWLGAVVAFLALAVIGLTNPDVQSVRSAYIAMDVIGWFVLVPLSLAALATGVMQSLGTEWGLFRHYWVLVKFVVSLGAAVFLLVHMQPTDRLAQAAAAATFSITDLHGLRIQLVADAGAAIAVLLVVTALSVFKPWGLTAYGWRKQQVGPELLSSASAKALAGRGAWGRYVLFGLALVVALVIVIHLLGGGLGGH